MKKLLFLLLASLLPCACFAQEILIGDMNGDNELTVSDVTSLIDALMNKSEKRYTYSADAFIKENALTGTFTINGIEKKYVNGVLDAYNGHDYVDLGLSVKWATINVDAVTPTGIGGYFGWGEIERKGSCFWDSYKYCNGTSKVMTKYCTNPSYGTVDGKRHLDTTDDLASVKWGGNWRTPTAEEFQELINNCYLVKTTNYNGTGYAGMIVYKAKVNRDKGVYGTTPSASYTLADTHIFLRAVGYRSGVGIFGDNSRGHYWTSSLSILYPNMASNFNFANNTISISDFDRCLGLPIRAVCP